MAKMMKTAPWVVCTDAFRQAFRGRPSALNLKRLTAMCGFAAGTQISSLWAGPWRGTPLNLGRATALAKALGFDGVIHVEIDPEEYARELERQREVVKKMSAAYWAKQESKP
jgi:hypothetical protein